MTVPKPVSTKDFQTKGFAPHGSMDLLTVGRFNVIEAHGPFNLELVKAGDSAQEELDAQLLAKKRWGTILIFRKSALASREAIAEIETILKRRKDQGICPSGVAIVLGPEVEGARIMSPHYLRAYTNAGYTAQVFADRESAESWLSIQIDS